MLSNFHAEQTIRAGDMPTTTIFLSYLTNTAPRHDRGCLQGVPARNGPESPAGTSPSPALGATCTAVPRVGEGRLGAVNWGRGTRGPPRTAEPPPGGVPRSPRPGARDPPPGRPVSAPGPKRSRGCVQVGRVLCRKSGNGERCPKPPEKGGNRKRRSRRGGRPGCRAAPGPHRARLPPGPAVSALGRRGMNEAPPPATGAHSQAT